jgi:hypothetical protein
MCLIAKDALSETRLNGLAKRLQEVLESNALGARKELDTFGGSLGIARLRLSTTRV